MFVHFVHIFSPIFVDMPKRCFRADSLFPSAVQRKKQRKPRADPVEKRRGFPLDFGENLC